MAAPVLVVLLLMLLHRGCKGFCSLYDIAAAYHFSDCRNVIKQHLLLRTKPVKLVASKTAVANNRNNSNIAIIGERSERSSLGTVAAGTPGAAGFLYSLLLLPLSSLLLPSCMFLFDVVLQFAQYHVGNQVGEVKWC